MENKNNQSSKSLSKQLFSSILETAIIRADKDKIDSLSIGNFYYELYEPIIIQLEEKVNDYLPKFKRCKNIKAKAIYQKAFDGIMTIETLRNERDIVDRIFLVNTCLNDALYVLEQRGE